MPITKAKAKTVRAVTVTIVDRGDRVPSAADHPRRAAMATAVDPARARAARAEIVPEEDHAPGGIVRKVAGAETIGGRTIAATTTVRRGKRPSPPPRR